MFEIESIILFTGILSFLLIAGLHLMRELDIFLKKDKKEREEERYSLQIKSQAEINEL